MPGVHRPASLADSIFQGHKVAVSHYSLSRSTRESSNSCPQSIDACFCGNALPYTLLEDSYCPTACTGAIANEKCGSSNTLSVYNASLLAATVPAIGNIANGTITRASATSSAASSNSGMLIASSTTMNLTTASVTAGAPSSTQTWVPRGCIADGSARALNQTFTYSLDLTIPKCAAIALSGNFQYFGIENGNQCFVSNTVAYNTSVTTCIQTCSDGTICGGPWSISAFEIVSLAPGQTLSTSVPSTPASSTPTTTPLVLATSALGTGTCAAVTVTQGMTVTQYVTVTAGTSIQGEHCLIMLFLLFLIVFSS